MSDFPCAFVEFGAPNGLPIVALHGAGGTGQTWAALALEGLPERRWICPDQRGHGETPLGDPPWTFERLARDVVLLMEALRIGQADVVGASMGARVAVELCRQAPSLVRSAVLLDPPLMTAAELTSYKQRPPSFADAQRGADPWGVDREWPTVQEYASEAMASTPSLAAVLFRRPVLYKYFQQACAAKLTDSPAGTYRLRLDGRLGPALVSALDSGPTSFGDIPAFGTFTGRVLILRAAHHSAVTDAGLAVVRNELQDRLDFTLMDTGHDVFWDDFDGTVSEIRQFF